MDLPRGLRQMIKQNWFRMMMESVILELEIYGRSGTDGERYFECYKRSDHAV